LTNPSKGEDTGRKKAETNGKRPRSLGSWILLLTVLLVIFLVLNQAQQPRDEQLTQDEFWYHLQLGRVEEANLHGNSQVRGRYRRLGKQEDSPFVVWFHDLSRKDDLIRELKARPLPQDLQLDTFLTQAGLVQAGVEQRAEAEEPGSGGAAVEFVPSADFALLVGQPLSLIPSTPRTETGRLPEKPRDEAFQFVATVLEKGKNKRYRVISNDGGGDLTGEDLSKLQRLWALASTPEAAAKQLRVAAPEWKELVSFDLSRGVQYEEDNSVWTQVLVSFLPWVLILFVFYFFVIRQMRSPGGGGILSFGRSRAHLYTKENRTGITFDDVAGVEEAKEEVAEIVEFLKNPQRFQRLGGRIPRGILLAGQPGTGKTLLAKAIAGEAEVPFFSISGSDFVEMFVGVGASRVRDLFRQAKENSPCIIFLDEIDAVGRKRGSGMGGGHDEREQTLNAILVEMDGFDTDEGIIVIAATNRPDVLDPALMRPGRFDREIVIDLPDVRGREMILRVHSRKVKMAPSVDLSVIARATPGFSGADLAAVINEAAIAAVMNGHDAIELADLEEARDKIRFGRQKKSRVMEREDKRITAYHEAGHAVVQSLLDKTEPVHKVTIIPRGMALGATMTLPTKDQYFVSRERMQQDLAVLYAGRIAEETFCGDITAGAQNDIQRATQLARLMVCEWGMSSRVGPINYGERQGSEFLGTEFRMGNVYSDDTAREIDQEVKGLLERSYGRARELIQANQDAMHRVAEGLLKYETLSGEEVQWLIAGRDIAPLRAGSAPAPRPPGREEGATASEPRREPSAPDLGLSGREGLSPA
jgi:cell division protease FtsH